jgi:hypothetical protein
MMLEGSRLRLDYQVTNYGDRVVQVVESLVWANTLVPEAVVVRNADEAHTVAFTRATVRTPAKTYAFPPPPAFVELVPGQTVSGFAFVRWPLHEWHNFDRVEPLRDEVTHAVFELGFVDSADVRLVQRELPDSTYMGSSSPGRQQLLRGERLPLPTLVH